MIGGLWGSIGICRASPWSRLDAICDWLRTGFANPNVYRDAPLVLGISAQPNYSADTIARPVPLTVCAKIPLLIEKESAMKYRVIIEQDEDGMFVAEVPALPGCLSQGQTRTEALRNIHEAIEGYIESFKAHDEPVPPSIHEEVIEVSI